MVFVFTSLSSVLSAVVLSYESLPDVLRDNLPASIKTIVTIMILLSSAIGSLIHIFSYPNKKGDNVGITSNPDKP
jgi:hypothetical protein